MKKIGKTLLSIILSFLIIFSNGFMQESFAWMVYNHSVVVNNISAIVDIPSGMNASNNGFDDPSFLQISVDGIVWKSNLISNDFMIQPSNMLPDILEPVSYNPSTNSFMNLFCSEAGEFSAAAATSGFVKFTFYIKSFVDTIVILNPELTGARGCVYAAVKTINGTQVFNTLGTASYCPVISPDAAGTDTNHNGIMDAAEAVGAGCLGPVVTANYCSEMSLCLLANAPSAIEVYMWAEVQNYDAHIENPGFSGASINISGYLMEAGGNDTGANVLTNVASEGAIELSADGQDWNSELGNEDFSAVQSNSFSPEFIQPVSFNPITQGFSVCLFEDNQIFRFFPSMKGMYISYKIYARLPYSSSETTVVNIHPELTADSAVFYSAVDDGENLYLYNKGGNRSYYPIADTNLTAYDANSNFIIDQSEAPQGSLGAMVTADNTGEIPLTFTEPGEVKELTVYMWAEGQDPSCNFYNTPAETMDFSLEFVAPEVTVSSIEVTKMPDKTEYIVGADYGINLNGMEITVHYTDRTSTISRYNDNRGYFNGYWFNFDYGDIVLGDNTITVRYMGKSTAFEITGTENPVSSIEVTKLPDKTTFIENVDGYWDAMGIWDGENYMATFCYSILGNGMELTVHYTNGTSAVWSYSKDGSVFNGFDIFVDDHHNSSPLSIGSNTVSVRYMGAQASFNVNIEASIISTIYGKSTRIDSENGFIFGLQPGITSLDGLVAVASGYEMTYIPTPKGFGTGTVVNAVSTAKNAASNSIVATYTVVIFGDVNGDGVIDIADSDMIIDIGNYALPQWDPVTDAANIKAGDLFRDGVIDENDCVVLKDVQNLALTLDQYTGEAT